METTALSISELDMEQAALLPARQVLGLFDVASVTAMNGAWAVNALSALTSATAAAGQVITVTQS